MADGTQSGKARVDTLAAQVVSVIAAKSKITQPELIEALISRMCDAVRDFDPDTRVSLLAEMRANGISDTIIAETLVPEAARRLGDAWCEDSLGFADVTIGAARLQSILRDLRTDRSVEVEHRLDSPVALLVVAESEYHTLGAMVVTWRLRRMGVAVRLSLGQSDEMLAETLQDSAFDIVMISASAGTRLEKIRNLVKLIRKGPDATVPIVVGGTVLDDSNIDIKTKTGADYTTNDPEEALRICGLKARNLAAVISPSEA